MKNRNWKRLERKTIYDTPFLKVYEDKVELPGGVIIEDYSLTKKPDIVLIIATDKNNKIIIGQEYKYAADKDFYSIPAGGVEEGETPIEAAKRELLEETGYGKGEFKLITELFNYPTKDLHKFYVIRAENVEKVTESKLERTESLKIELVSLAVLKQQVKDFKWDDANNVAAFTLSGILN